MRLSRIEAELSSDLEKFSGSKILHDICGENVTTMSVGGRFSFFVEPNSEEELIKVVSFLKANDQGFRILGAGSNLVISDAGINDWVIRLGKSFRYFNRINADTVEVGGAMPLMMLSKNLSEDGLSGLEFAAGIPALVGGAVRMNAGAHGGEFGNLVEQVQFVDQTGKLDILDRASLEWRYRHCSLPDNSIVTRVTLKLAEGKTEEILLERRNCLAERKARQPLAFPSSGSVFRNPGSDKFAGSLIEAVGLKGHAIGEAKISEMHANWIVNPNKRARAKEVKRLVNLAKDTVFKHFEIELIPEIIFWD